MGFPEEMNHHECYFVLLSYLKIGKAEHHVHGHNGVLMLVHVVRVHGKQCRLNAQVKAATMLQLAGPITGCCVVVVVFPVSNNLDSFPSRVGFQFSR